jgi:hypothetical protein
MSRTDEPTQYSYEKWLQDVKIIWDYKIIFIEFKSSEKRKCKSPREERMLKLTYSAKYENKTSAEYGYLLQFSDSMDKYTL